MLNLKSKVLISSSLLLLMGIGWSTGRLFKKTPQVSSKPTINLTISNYSELNRSDNQNIQVLANVDKKQATSAFDKAAGRRDTDTQVQKSSNEKVTTVSEKNNGVVVAVETTNTNTNESNTLVNEGNKLILTKTVYNTVSKKYDTKVAEVLLGVVNSNIQTVKVTYGSWNYTNIAIGKSALAFTLDWVGPQAVVSKLATIFRVSAKVANGFIAGLALNTAGFGDRIANYLDKNHNGWIGLYQRWKKDTSFKNGLVAQNITYTEWKTE